MFTWNFDSKSRLNKKFISIHDSELTDSELYLIKLDSPLPHLQRLYLVFPQEVEHSGPLGHPLLVTGPVTGVEWTLEDPTFLI